MTDQSTFSMHASPLDAATDIALEAHDRALSDWNWQCDSHMRLVSCSPLLAHMFAATPLTLRGRLVNELFLSHRWRDILEASFFQDEPMIIRDAEGHVHHYRVSAQALEEEGKFAGFSGIGVRDHQPMPQGRPVQGDFLSAMSHELRTPLNAIIGFAEAMRLELFGPLARPYDDYAQDIAQAGRHLLGLIDDVLDVSSIAAGDVHVEPGRIDMAQLAQRARGMVEMPALTKAQALHVHMPNPPSLPAWGDERRSLQILINLLNNAIKFTPTHGQIHMRLGISGAYIYVQVQDNGPGIAGCDHERVFEKFEQLSQDIYRDKPQGTGLGLHISRMLARRMGGDVLLESQLGQGACFTLMLPREAMADESA